MCVLTCLLAAGAHYLPNVKDVAAAAPLPKFILAGEMMLPAGGGGGGGGGGLNSLFQLRCLSCCTAAKPLTPNHTSALSLSRIASCQTLSSPLHLGCSVARRSYGQLIPEVPFSMGPTC